MDPGDQNLTLDDFITWKLPALRDFLTKRGLSKDGSKKELSALCFAACTMKLPLVITGACILKQNQEDYSKLLYIDDGHTCIPDPLLLHTGWVEEKLGLSKWPPVYITDIINFIVTRQSSTAVQTILNDYKIGKAYEYFQSGHLQEVYYHSISTSSTNCILSAKCIPSQRMKDDSHTVWVCCCKESGAVKSAYCTCTAGLGSTCNHVAGLLFRVEAANKLGIASCTSVPCAWDVPSGQKRVEPCQLKNMTIRKSRHGEAGKRPLISKSKSSFDPVGKDVIGKDDMLNTFVTALKDVLPNSCLKRGTVHGITDVGLEATCTPKSPKFDIHQYTISSLLQKSTDATNFMETLPNYSEEECRAISLATNGQGENPLWHDIRQDRLTSSNFYSVHTKMVSHMSKETNMEPLLCNMLGYRKINQNIKSIKHGRELEPEAKQSYKREMLKSFHSKVSISDCGIFLHQKHSYLGASPDLLVTFILLSNPRTACHHRKKLL